MTTPLPLDGSGSELNACYAGWRSFPSQVVLFPNSPTFRIVRLSWPRTAFSIVWQARPAGSSACGMEPRFREMSTSRILDRLSDFAALTAELPDSSASERVTLDEAIALALDANRLAKTSGRRQLITQGVMQAYDAVQGAQRTLEIREETLRTSRELERLVGDQAERGEAAASVVLEARAARVRAQRDVRSARQDLDAWRGQLNHLIGRDPQAGLLVTGEPEPAPAAASRLSVGVTGQ